MSTRTIDTGTENFLATIENGVAILTLNRPESRNAMTVDMWASLENTLAEVELDSDVRCVVLKGSGKGFCAGGDVKSMAESGTDVIGEKTIDSAIHRQRVSQRGITGRLFKMPKPTLASVQGPAVGAGLSLALACDLRVMADTGIMMTAFARVGLSGDYGGTYFMTQLVGSAKARELFFLSERISAEEALRLGLANWVVPENELESKTMEIANRLASGPSVAYRYMKENLNRAIGGYIDECLDLEATHHIHTGLTQDHHDAAVAFVEKREPVFKGY